MAGDRKVVWILGAGFSRPLGGPLLDGLISSQMAGDFVNWSDFNEERNTPEGYDKITCARAVQSIYALGCEQEHSTFWSNAEEFLERLDMAHRDTTNLWDFRIRKLIPGTMTLLHLRRADSSASELAHTLVEKVSVLRREAIRFVAASCSYFTRDLRDLRRLEAWGPYLRWGNKLAQQDTIITFNYDNVLDQLERHIAAGLRWAYPKDAEGNLGVWGSSHGATVYHLHGHVGWVRDDEGGVRRGDPNAHLEPEKAVLGTPGPAKMELSEKYLGQVWHRSFYELETADVICFVGYRFPESDGLARGKLLEALRQNKNAVTHVVLGPHNRDTPRVEAMINWTRKDDNRAKVHQMWCQDFFDAFERNLL